jgi:uncharacterized protein
VYHDRVTYSLTPIEARILGSLVEKEITTPEYYPLSLNALLNAANQKSNRHPVMELDQGAVRQALQSLGEQGLVRSAATDSRVAKFEHRLADAFNFHRHEIALLCVLLLRGPQTPGELRSRTDRLYQFDDLGAVHSALNLLMNRQPPLVKVLPRQSGTKEVRYVELLSAQSPEGAAMYSAPAETSSPVEVPDTVPKDSDRIAHLEDEVADLRAEVADLKNQLAAFQKQFQ